MIPVFWGDFINKSEGSFLISFSSGMCKVVISDNGSMLILLNSNLIFFFFFLIMANSINKIELKQKIIILFSCFNLIILNPERL